MVIPASLAVRGTVVMVIPASLAVRGTVVNALYNLLYSVFISSILELVFRGEVNYITFNTFRGTLLARQENSPFGRRSWW
jgi:hypothetical protein